MKIQYAEPKVIRMDINNDFLKKRIQPLGNLSITPEALVYPIVTENEIPINLRIRSTIMNEKIEVLGYTSEFKAVLCDTKNGIDLKEISKFIQNSFLNYQYYFDQNAPIELKFVKFETNLDPNKIANLFLDIIHTP